MPPPLLRIQRFLICFLILFPTHSFAQGIEPLPYREFPLIGSRNAVWIAAELHLMFAAFVLAIPLFAVVIEFVGYFKREERWDRLAKDFAKLLPVSYAATALFGGLLTFLLFTLYPKFMAYLSEIFAPTMWLYALLFFAESATLYIYWYSWDRLKGRYKWVHLLLAILLNIFGTAVMFIGNAWATFMMSPSGIDETGKLVSLWGAISNLTLWPLNIHRLIANLTFGGFVASAYAAYRFLAEEDPNRRAHYDWMGYVGNFVGVMTMIFLPFAGYWFGIEIYRFNAQMGITLMGGALSFLWVVQAILIAAVFIGSAYYIWIGMGRIPGAERYQRWLPAFSWVLILSFAIWATPHTLVASLEEAQRIGATYHPLLTFLGIMPAKIAVVNIVIILVLVSFLLYQRANREVVRRKALGFLVIAIPVLLALGNLVVGWKSYLITTAQRINLTIWTFFIMFAFILVTYILNFISLKGARSLGEIRWGEMPPRSQYALIVVAVSAVWLMGLMGYARSGARLNWHVYGIMEDTSKEAWLPSLGEATIMISIIVLIFLAIMAFIFWITGLVEKEEG